MCCQLQICTQTVHQARIFKQLQKQFASMRLLLLDFLFSTCIVVFKGEDVDGTHKTAFRKWFSYFGELRSICPCTTLLE